MEGASRPPWCTANTAAGALCPSLPGVRGSLEVLLALMSLLSTVPHRRLCCKDKVDCLAQHLPWCPVGNLQEYLAQHAAMLALIAVSSCSLTTQAPIAVASPFSHHPTPCIYNPSLLSILLSSYLMHTQVCVPDFQCSKRPDADFIGVSTVTAGRQWQ